MHEKESSLGEVNRHGAGARDRGMGLEIMSAWLHACTGDWNVGGGPVRKQLRLIRIGRFHIPGRQTQIRGRVIAVVRCVAGEGRADWEISA
jgi:hypothetical protein